MTNKQDIWNELVRQVEKDIILADSGNHGLDCPDYDMEQLKELLACEDVISLNQKVAEAGEGVITRMFSHLRSNLFDWLPIEKTERVLFIGADAGCFANSAAEKAKEVICLNPDFSDAVVAAHRVKNSGHL